MPASWVGSRGALRSPFFAPTLAVLCFALGCGGGGGSGGGSSTTISTSSSISSVTVVPSAESSTITFEAVSPNSHTLTAEISFSQDRGAHFYPATITSGALVDLESSPSGVAHEITWDTGSDLDNFDQSDLMIRVVPMDETNGAHGLPAYSEVFSLGENTPPEIIAISTPTGTQGGQVLIDYTVRDEQSDSVAISILYSLDGGSSWQTGTPGAGESASSASTTPTGVAHTVSWNAQVDASGNVSSQVIVQLVPMDVEEGTGLQTGAFAINLRGPTLQLLSVGEIPAEMNGSTPYTDENGNSVEFHLAVPRAGFRLTVEYTPANGGGDVDPDSLVVTADRDLAGAPAGSNLAARFSTTPNDATWDVSTDDELPTGMITLTAVVDDDFGNVSNTDTLTFEVVNAGASTLPFDHPDRWWLNFGSDFFSITGTQGSTVVITSTQGANGTADYVEDLRIIGLQSLSPTPQCAAIGSNQILLQWVENETLERLRILYGADFEGNGGFHPNLIFSLDPAGHQSAIRIGGDDANDGFTLGRAEFDSRNSGGNNDQSTTLGIFTTNIIDYYINSSYLFQSRFNPLIPGRGVPAGQHALDATVLSPYFDRAAYGNTAQMNARYDDIAYAIDAWARIVSVVLAHEIGHSVGLCANGPPPQGLFGGVQGPIFSGPYSTEYHFDSPGNNIMAGALSFAGSLISTQTGYRFNELNETYLRQWTVLR